MTKRIDKSVLIRRKDGGELKIKAVTLSSAVVRCSIEPTEKSSAWRVVLSLDPKSMNESLWGEVVVETDYRVQPWVKFPVAAIVARSN